MRQTQASDPADSRHLANRPLVVGELREEIESGDLPMPVLPSNAREALGLALESEPDIREIMRVVERDPALAARIMEAANSALHGGHGLVTSVRSALQRLGVATIQELLMRAVMESQSSEGRNEARLEVLRRHSLLTAHLTKHLAAKLGGNADYAFACGLFHDLGHSLVLALLQRNCQQYLPREESMGLCDMLHSVAGERLLSAWDLPPLIVEAARTHHDYGSPDDPLAYSYMGNLVAAADRILYCSEFAAEPEPEHEAQAEAEAGALEALGHLGLGPETLGELREWVQKLIDGL
ncbi:MAG: HDOD domain-containing protein [Nannocystaceae bacterium]